MCGTEATYNNIWGLEKLINMKIINKNENLN